MKLYLGIDLGGTNVKAGIVNEEGKILGKGNVSTNLPCPADEVADKMAEASRLAAEAAGVQLSDLIWAGIGTPGIANVETGVVEYSANLDFDNVPLERMMEERLGLNAFIENDANAAGYGEFCFGAAMGSHKALVITLGTGVGGGVVVDDRIYAGFNYAGAEVGHIVTKQGGRLCNCGRKGCFETYASATGLIRTTREAMEENKESLLWQLAPTLDAVDGKTAFDAMRLGDAVGTKVVEQYIEDLATGLTNLLNIFQPEVCVIGGGICKEGDTLLLPLRERVMKEIYLGKNSPAPDIRIAKLGNDAGIIGAAMLGRTRKKI